MSGLAHILGRLGREIRVEAGAFAWSGVTAGLAVRAASASILAIVTALVLHLDNPYWAGITAFQMLQGEVSATLARSFDRVLGTIAGAALGYAVAATVDDHVAFSTICAVIVGFTLYAQARVDHGYAVLLIGVTALLVMFGSLATPNAALSIAVYRGLEIMVGAVAASVADVLFARNRGDSHPSPPKPGIFTKPVDVDLLVIAITAGLAIASVPTIWRSLELPGIGQMPITAFVIMNAIPRDAHWTAIMRIFGCITGGAYGLLCISLIDDSLVLLIGLLFLGLYLSAYVLQRRGEASYAGSQAGVAIMLAMVEGTAPSVDLLPAIDRLVGIFGGIVLVAVFHNLFSPVIRRLVLAVI